MDAMERTLPDIAVPWKLVHTERLDMI